MKRPLQRLQLPSGCRADGEMFHRSLHREWSTGNRSRRGKSLVKTVGGIEDCAHRGTIAGKDPEASGLCRLATPDTSQDRARLSRLRRPSRLIKASQLARRSSSALLWPRALIFRYMARAQSEKYWQYQW